MAKTYPDHGSDATAYHRTIILFLAANPSTTTRLRLDEEVRAIDQALRQANYRDQFDLRQHWAVRVADLQELLLRHQPHIVHFSGHGSPAGQLFLEDDRGREFAVSPDALSRLFAILRDRVRCVVLNACYSEPQAQAIAASIDCVIGMPDSIGDAASLNFAASFYQALAYGRDVQTAYDLGCNRIDLHGLDEPRKPKLLAHRGDPRQVVFVMPATAPAPSQRLATTEAAVMDQQVKQGIAVHLANTERLAEESIGYNSKEPVKLKAAARQHRQEPEQVAFRKLQAEAARQEIERAARLLADQQPLWEACEDARLKRDVEEQRQELSKLFNDVLEELRRAVDSPSLSQRRNEEIARRLSRALVFIQFLRPNLEGTSLTPEQRRLILVMKHNVYSAVDKVIDLLSAEPAKLKAEARQHAHKEERRGDIRKSDKSTRNPSSNPLSDSIFSSGSSSGWDEQNRQVRMAAFLKRHQGQHQPSDKNLVRNSVSHLLTPRIPYHIKKQSEQQTKQAASLEFQSEAARQEAERKTGIELVRIPAGEFPYGDSKVHLSEYWIAKTPVTNAQYAAFIQATGYRAPDHWQNGRIPTGKENHPVVYVNWDDAQSFCQWAGLRLPLELEWLIAAQGTEWREYPWGNQKPDDQRCNSSWAARDTTPVGKFPLGASVYGVLDMAGNVWEWCEDWYDTQQTMRVLKGGSWSDPTTFVRTAFTFWGVPGIRLDNRGIRCAR